MFSLLCLGLSKFFKSIRLKGHRRVLVLPWVDLILRTLHTKVPHSLNSCDLPAPMGCTLSLRGPASPWLWAQHWLHHILPTSGQSPVPVPKDKAAISTLVFICLIPSEPLPGGLRLQGMNTGGQTGKVGEAGPQAPEEGEGDEQRRVLGGSQPGIGHQNGVSFPKGVLWPWCPHLTQPASCGSPTFLGQEAKTRSKGSQLRPLAGWAAFSGSVAWIGGL